MNLEIERKFLIKDIGICSSDIEAGILNRIHIIQFYLNTSHTTIPVRVRIERSHSSSVEEAFLNIKNKGTVTRKEFEYYIPVEDAREMINMAKGSIIYKTRYVTEIGSNIWEIDEFYGSLNGLWLAEIELKEENQEFFKPAWLGEEVTENVAYKNDNLAILGRPQ